MDLIRAFYDFKFPCGSDAVVLVMSRERILTENA